MNTNNTTTSKGLRWGPFTLRIPFIHIKFRAGEFFQGMVISGATAFAAVPVAMAIPKKNSEMASALLIAVFITFFSAWVGLLVGIILSILVIGIDKTKN